MYRGMARRLCVLFSLSIGMRITRDGIRETQFDTSSWASDIVDVVGVLPGEGVSRRREVTIGSAWSWSDGSGTVRVCGSARVGVAAAGEAGRGRRARGGVLTRLEDGGGGPPGPKP